MHKEGSKSDPANYRPISLLTSFSKNFESLINKRNMSFVGRHRTLTPKQFWFQPKKILHQCINKVHWIHIWGTRTKTSWGVIIHRYKKAFDTVNHHILISKLERYGFRGKTLDLIKSYFSDRSQYIFLNSKTSNSIDVNYGVPQGSILGPNFFLIYINDMPQCCSYSEVVLYADDTTITSCSVNENAKFSSDVQNVKKWFDQNCLTINENKCMLLPFGRNKRARYLDGVFKDVQIKDQC